MSFFEYSSYGDEAKYIGPFRPAPSLTVYFVSDGSPCKIRLLARRADTTKGDRIMIRLFDTEERIISWEYVEPGENHNSWYPGGREIKGIPIDMPEKPAPGDLLLDRDLLLPAKDGIYQLRIVAGAEHTLIYLEMERPLPFCVSGQNGPLYGWDDNLTKAYLYIPKGEEKLWIMQKHETPVVVFDEMGKELIECTKDKGKVTIPIERTDVVWRLSLPSKRDWCLEGGDFPIIICESELAAKEIHGSLDILEDGSRIYHKFQADILKLLPILWTEEKIGKAEELIVPLNKHEKEWLEDPIRNIGIYNFLKYMPYVLRFQEKSGEGHSKYLGIVYALKEPFNPYGGKSEILYRGTVSALKKLLEMREDEVMPGIYSDVYPGYMAFNLPDHCESFASLAPDLSDKIRKIWTEGLRRMVDRHIPSELVTCRNQSAHYVKAIWDFYRGSEEERYRELAQRYAQRMARSARPAGYMIEAFGADGTYIGITNWLLAYYQLQSGDKEILEALRRIFNFYNHTVAPEPDGTIIGCSDYAHRTPGSFVHAQHGGAKGMLADVLPEAALWTSFPPTEEAKEKFRQDSIISLKSLLSQPVPSQDAKIENLEYIVYLAYLAFPYSFYGPRNPQHGIWPAKEDRSFTRNFGNEFIAVRRPGYYAFFYVSHSAPSEFYIRDRKEFRQVQLKEKRSGIIDNAYYLVTPYCGGGLSLFWTPEFGTLISGANWAPTTHHGLIATTEEGDRYWEDYFATRFELSKDNRYFGA